MLPSWRPGAHGNGFKHCAGQNKIVPLPTCSTLLTSNGGIILNHLQAKEADPLVRFVCRACHSFGERNGDGVIRLLLMVTAALDAVRAQPLTTCQPITWCDLVCRKC